jgi:hypothetical protein
LRPVFLCAAWQQASDGFAFSPIHYTLELNT